MKAWSCRGALALAILASAVPVHAQWRLDASAGGLAHESLGAASAASSSNLMLALGYDGARWLYLSAGGPLSGQGIFWGAAGVGGREAASRLPVKIGIDWSLHLHAYAPTEATGTGNGLVADAIPFLGAEAGPLRMEVRSGVSHYRAAFAGETAFRTGHDSGLALAIRPHRRILASADARVLRVEGAAYRYTGASAEVAIPGGVVAVHGGGWSGDQLPDADWGVDIDLGIGSRTSLRAGYRQDATDPLYWNATRRFWSVGLSRLFGARDAGEAGPARLAPPLAPEMAAGGVVFRVPVSAVDAAPAVAGDFNQWSPVLMRKVGDDWIAILPLEPGIHHFAFRGADGRWFLPDSVPHRVDDGFGGTNGVIVVPEPPRL
jgi:hypothetical protein